MTLLATLLLPIEIRRPTYLPIDRHNDVGVLPMPQGDNVQLDLGVGSCRNQVLLLQVSLNLGRLKEPCQKYGLLGFLTRAPGAPGGPSVGLPRTAGGLPEASETEDKPNQNLET